MGGLGILSAIGLPLAMAFGAIAAWRMSKKENDPEQRPPEWRDDSLDDWRRERDEQAMLQRQTRTTKTKTGAHEVVGGGEEGETQRHQRIGG
jgi:hypothetical protein